MTRYRVNKGQRHTVHTASGSGSFAAAVPALAMCLVTLLMLVLEIAMPSMASLQYRIYPAAVKFVSLVSIVCTAACISAAIGRENDNMPARSGSYVKPAALLFAIFIICILISTCVNGLSRAALFGLPYRYIGAFDLIVFISMLMYCTSLVRSEKIRSAILMSYILTADLIAAAFITDCLTGCIEVFRSKSELSAVFFHANHYGYFLVMAVIISAGLCIYGSRAQVISGSLSLAVNILALAFNMTKGAAVAIGIVIPAMSISAATRSAKRHDDNPRSVSAPALIPRSAKRHDDNPRSASALRTNSGASAVSGVRVRAIALLGIFGLMAAAALAVNRTFLSDILLMVHEGAGLLTGQGNRYAGYGRWNLWILTLDYIREHPLVGYGCEGIRDMIYDITEIGNPHCEPLTYAAFFGVPAAASYVLAVLLTIIRRLLARSSPAIADPGIPEGINTDQRAAAASHLPESGITGLIAAYAALGYFISSLFGVAMFYTAPFLFIMLGLAL